ncbi:hypothetical protein QKT49_gp461 [Acanthamoeba castellanii medusavirus]|uniref:Uncharacterized protein n=1 Tax=Acanthamoeba castellanii medusavirus J1 TaxID=3114988 RepID=A0A3T1CWU1_9VIRU|nr:hypothetical protein QKT49_gp461 [Acanthamoeba castellanii medusavirus]BBI30302.1 hypothetical protein [Acanthamoeba castellanii medusavirus J1]
MSTYVYNLLFPTASKTLLEERGITPERYSEMAQRAIETVRALPRSYLSKAKADAIVEAIRAGTCQGDAELLNEGRAAIARYREHLKNE